MNSAILLGRDDIVAARTGSGAERFRTDLWVGKNGVWVGAALTGRSPAFFALRQERELRRREGYLQQFELSNHFS
jgi:hypothetical protein